MIRQFLSYSISYASKVVYCNYNNNSYVRQRPIASDKFNMRRMWSERNSLSFHKNWLQSDVGGVVVVGFRL